MEGPALVAQVKHIQRLSLAKLEALALEMADLGERRETPRLVVLTEAAWKLLNGGLM